MPHRFRLPLTVLALLLLTAGALWLGVQKLEHRPMHADESVHAEKFGAMLEEPGLGQYVYNPNEYHGPTLYYVTHLVAAAYGKGSLDALEARHLRTSSVIFGALLVLCLILLIDGLSPTGVIISALLTMATPIIVYYSRDFIHETTFVFFTMLTIAAGWRYTRAPQPGASRAIWAVIFGAAIALMWASKEQVVIVMGAMTLAFGFNCGWRWLGERKRAHSANGEAYHHADARAAQAPPISRTTGDQLILLVQRIPWLHVMLAAVAMFVVWITLFSSFFTNWFVTGGSGLRDSVMTYFSYLGRGLAQGESAEIHHQPWHFYLHQLGWVSNPPAPVWTSALTLGLAAVGGVVGFVPKWAGWADARLARFLAVYALLLLLFFSILPYKQPWLLMGPVHGFILLAGVGGAALLRGARHARSSLVLLSAGGVGLLIGYVSLPYQPTWGWILSVTAIIVLSAVSLAAVMRVLPGFAAQIVVALALATGIAHLAHQTRWASLRFAADPRNPLSHAQTSSNVRNLEARMHALAEHHPRGRSMEIRVVSAVPWPMPWYLRQFDRVGFYDTAVAMKNQPLDVDVLIVDTRFLDIIENRLNDTGLMDDFEARATSVYGLRPGVFLRVYVKDELWQKFMAQRR